MREAVYLVVVLNYLLVLGLPAFYFRRGTPNARWFLTGMPVVLGLFTTMLSWHDLLQPWDLQSGRRPLVFVGVTLCVASIFLIGLTTGTHRYRPALWHQDDDAPREIVTWGPYAWVRHPFYTSFLALYLGAVLVVPSLLSVSLAVAGFVALALTARREERRLLSSSLGEEYALYAARTGRFLPGVGRIRRGAGERRTAGAAA